GRPGVGPVRAHHLRPARRDLLDLRLPRSALPVLPRPRRKLQHHPLAAMAGIQGPNQLVDLLRALKRRRYQVIVPALLVATLGIAFAVIVPKRYRVSTRIE